MNPGKKKRILIVGGVAGGASCATRARRLCENCDIVLFERGPHVSFANCGLPYFVGDVIQSEAKLLVATPQLFRERFNIDVRTETEVVAINRETRMIEVRDLRSGEVDFEHYDALVLATGATPIRPSLPGIDLPGIHVVRTIPDSRKLKAAVSNAGSAVMVGGGFIGLEMAENLAGLGLKVTVLELANQVLPPLDPEMAFYVAERLQTCGVQLRLGEAVEAFTAKEGGGLSLQTSRGSAIESDLVILGIGVRPEVSLARKCSLELGERGGIRVDEFLHTSDPNIWAVGDVVEVKNRITGEWQLMPLAGPANRQGRIAASHIIYGFRCKAGQDAPPPLTFDGILGTAVCEVFGLTVATTGVSEKALRRAGIEDFQAVFLHPGHHVSYFPGAKPIHMKLLFSVRDGRILGAQAIGEADVARRIDVIATAMMQDATVYDLEEFELCYAPQFGAAKDPVNMAGMIASNVLRGDLALANWNDISNTDALILDVRSPAEFDAGYMPDALNIPLETLRERLAELPVDREILLVCGVGQRAYYAARTLKQAGFQVSILSGGMQTYRTFVKSTDVAG
ncbi:CoA-disulfide reductase [Candidatus Methylospira mobilis]|uniref:CoA-disulfide reductase n=1 Tax=Candidatus Methylospira mobilis TaxID=1808979 RepID=A0A5Q0BCJ5_9GAMM|nr:FAD-dependent oxidoreductase [Candidatus Methylospira mobilis]QFY41219.1 CoA-disulfide reductase [Candidatus Methylospira mobilis]